MGFSIWLLGGMSDSLMRDTSYHNHQCYYVIYILNSISASTFSSCTLWDYHVPAQNRKEMQVTCVQCCLLIDWEAEDTTERSLEKQPANDSISRLGMAASGFQHLPPQGVLLTCTPPIRSTMQNTALVVHDAQGPNRNMQHWWDPRWYLSLHCACLLMK